MSTNTEFNQILAAINKLSGEVHELNVYLGRLDERFTALDSKVDNRVHGVEVQVKGLENRVQVITDRCQDVEIRLNRLLDSHAKLQKDYDRDQLQKAGWMNRFVIPLVLAGCIATISTLITLSTKG
jgi:chromosome segregation ATPase